MPSLFGSLRASDKAPYLLTVLFGLLGWGVTHVIDRVLKSPTLEYRCATHDALPRRALSCLVRNVSEDRVFADLIFVIRIPDGSPGRVEDPRIVWEAPAYPPGDNPVPRASGGDAEYVLAALNPGAAVVLTAVLNRETNYSLHLRGNKDAPVRFIRAVFETFLVGNETRLVVALVAVGSLLALYFLFFSS